MDQRLHDGFVFTWRTPTDFHRNLEVVIFVDAKSGLSRFLETVYKMFRKSTEVSYRSFLFLALVWS